jgi:hypothetical protein
MFEDLYNRIRISVYALIVTPFFQEAIFDLKHRQEAAYDPERFFRKPPMALEGPLESRL